jgi:hypothetical protein
MSVDSACPTKAVTVPPDYFVPGACNACRQPVLSSDAAWGTTAGVWHRRCVPTFLFSDGTTGVLATTNGDGSPTWPPLPPPQEPQL